MERRLIVIPNSCNQY